MKRSYLVSIIIPTHNRSHFLLEAVDSVLNQSYADWELIIIADACTDNTSELIKPYLQDHRITITNTAANLGGGGARNLGLDMANGEYISFLDDDDIWHQNKIETQLNFLKRNPQTSLVYCNFNQWRHSGIKKEVILKSSTSLKELLVVNRIGSFSFVMVTSKELGNTRIDSELRSAQDWDLWTKLLENSNTVAQNCNMNLVDYRIQGQKKISINKDSVSSGYEKWYLNNAHNMSDKLNEYHEVVISIKNENNWLNCVKLGLDFIFKNPTSINMNIVISKLIYTQVFR